MVLKMRDGYNQVQNAKEVFKKCGTCSQTFAHLLNRDFGHPDVEGEKALDPLAGGIANYGHQCGMLWGSAMAIGAEAYRRFDDHDKALAVAVTATQHVVESFVNRTQTVNCKEIIGHNLRNVFGLASYMIKTMSKGMKNSQCFNLAEDWAPEAMQASKEGLKNDKIALKHQPISCASEVVKKMGGSEEEMMMVSGYAGGLGLSGEACGALSAAIWYQTLKWCKANPKKRPPMFNNTIAKKLIKAFKVETNDCVECEKITGRRFETIEDHSAFLHNGGCKSLINLLSETKV